MAFNTTTNTFTATNNNREPPPPPGTISVGDETVHYWLFPHHPNGARITERSHLEALVDRLMAHVAQYTHTHIWHHHAFALKVRGCEEEEEGKDWRKRMHHDEEEGGKGALGPHLTGSTCVGDYLEDEWFIVYLLLTLTKDFPGLVCRVVDSDGEFLLVEAADHLPAWATPETACQRVYLYGGQVHLIPVAESPASLSPLPRGTPSVMHAASAVNRLPDVTVAPPPVQNAITNRLSGYPGRISKEQHVAHAYVPVGVAALLREYPTLVGPAVHAFCCRDAIDNKVLRVMRHFPPETRVTTAVRFSKALYAQLAAHRYTPDARVGWDLPHPTNPAFKVHDIGMKLACGFEILVCSAGGVTPTTPTTTSAPNAPTQPHTAPDPRWLRYHKALTEKGYFRGELEGSKLYKALEDNARQYFESHVVSGQASQDGEDLTVGAMVVKLLTKVNVDHEFYKERSTRLIPADDDSWLQITPDALDDLLESKYGKNSIPRGASEKEMMDSLSAFLGHMSDLEGAEVPQRKVSTLSTPKRKTSKGGRKLSTSLLGQHHLRKVSAQSTASDVSNSSEMSSFSNKVDFSAEAFSDAMANILESGVPDDDYWCGSDDESSGMSSYEGEEGVDVSLSRKSSNTSSTSSSSSSSSSKGDQMRQYMKEMEEELAGTKIADTLTPAPSATTPTAAGTSSEDEFGDVEDFCPVKVDLKAVQDLVKTYSAQNGLPGPASSLLGSVGLKPKNA